MLIKVKVNANSKSESLRMIAADRYVFFVKQPAENNMANERVILMAKKIFGNRAKIRIVSGHHKSSKILSVD